MKRRLATLVFCLSVVGLGVGYSLFSTAHAQRVFSNADLYGTYVFHASGNGNWTSYVTFCDTPRGSQHAAPCLGFPGVTPLAANGLFVADGNGNITSGSLFLFNEGLRAPFSGPDYLVTVGDSSCSGGLNGTYLINPDGSGTIALVGCAGGATFNIILAQSGGVFYGTVPSDSGPPFHFDQFLSGVFLRQQ